MAVGRKVMPEGVISARGRGCKSARRFFWADAAARAVMAPAMASAPAATARKKFGTPAAANKYGPLTLTRMIKTAKKMGGLAAGGPAISGIS